jgi:serine/threonine-protein kinase
MEYVDGITLDDFINTKQGVIVEERAYPIFDQILGAFTYAHKKGIIHRDIKPANIILTNDDEGNFVVKVLDFGIAKIISDSNNDEKNAIVGTPAYMSPEQVCGAKADERSDIYSLGVLLHQMLTGRAPYDTTTLSKTEIERRVVEDTLPRMKEFYGAHKHQDKLQGIVDKATAKDTAKRFQNCSDFRRTLKNIFEPEKFPRPVKYAAVAVIALLVAGSWWFWDYNYNTKVYYYKDYVEQWGVPVGIGDADYKHREASYRFEKLRGKIVRVSYVNSKGCIVEHHDSEHTERIINDSIFYTGDGKVDYIKVMDRNGKALYKKDYDEKLKTVIFKHDDEFGTEMSLALNTTKLFTNPFTNSNNSRGKISRYLLTFNDNGFVKRIQFAGFQNVLVCDKDNLYGKEYIVDEKGRVKEEHYLGKDGAPKSNKAGLAIKKFEYDENDDWTKVTYYAANGEPSSDGNGCPVVVIGYDKWGNRIKETYYDSEGNLALRTDCRVAGFSYQTNEEGYRISYSAFGIDGNPCYYGNGGYSSIEEEYDANGYLSNIVFKDLDGKQVSNSAGYVIKQFKNDNRGNVLEEAFFDVANQPCETTDGFFKAVCEYDSSGNLTSLSFFDTNDSLCLTMDGYAKQLMKYDDKNRLVEYAGYGINNQPCVRNDGTVTVKFEYDTRGNQI